MKDTKQTGAERTSPKNRKFRILMGIGLVLLAVALTGFLVYRSLFVKPALPDSSEGPDASSGPNASPSATLPGPDTDEPYEEGIRPRTEGERKSEDFYTILILGRDTGGGGNTDTILLASYDVTNQKAAVMSIPRDTMINVPWDMKKINSVYNWYGGGDRGIQKLYQEISQLVGYEPDFQVVVEWEAVGELVDAMGGVWFDVPYNMEYDDSFQDLSIHQEAGYRLLTGDDAMQVIRWRKNNPGSVYGYTVGIGDSGRIKLQQSFLKALVEQLLTPQNIVNISKFSDIFLKNVETDLTVQNLLWFGQQALLGGLDSGDVTFLTMPYAGATAWSRTVSADLSYVVPIGDELLELVNTHLSPYAEEFSLEDIDIMSVNPDGSLSSSTGQVEDTEATFPRSHWFPTGETEE